MEILSKEILIEDFFKAFPPLPVGFVKGVVDVEKKIIAVDAEWHVDLEQLLLEYGSVQADLWGINLHQDLPKTQWVEFDSVINIRPRANNRTRSVDDPEIAAKIKEIVNQWIV